MPKKAALKFHDVQEAIDWASKPVSETMRRHQHFDLVLMRFIFSRPIPGVREACLEGSQLFEKAAEKASELAFELEGHYLRFREEVLPIEKGKIDELAQDLLLRAQACHQWSPGGSARSYLDKFARRRLANRRLPAALATRQPP